MNLKAASVIFVALSCLCIIALAQGQRDVAGDDLHKDIAELRKSIAELTSRLEAMDERLSKLEKAASGRIPAISRTVPATIERGNLTDEAESQKQRAIERGMLLDERTSEARKQRDQEDQFRRMRPTGPW